MCVYGMFQLETHLLLAILYGNGNVEYSNFRFTYTCRNSIKSLRLSKSNSYFTDKFRLSRGCRKHIQSFIFIFIFILHRVTSCLHPDCYRSRVRENLSCLLRLRKHSQINWVLKSHERVRPGLDALYAVLSFLVNVWGA